jgi:enamine deaminase RidA (YjgF/YER057c/UK114 family)
MSTIEDRLAELGLALPDPPHPAGAYSPTQRAGNLLFISGQFPISGSELRYVGRLGEDLDAEQGFKAARLAALNVLSQIRCALGGFDPLVRIVRLDGHLHAAPGFTGHARVLDGASQLFHEVLADRAGHARTVYGQAAMPLDLALELAVIAEVR